MDGMTMPTITKSWNVESITGPPCAATCYQMISVSKYSKDELMRARLVTAIDYDVGHIGDRNFNAAELMRL
jgi:hypothetical protein